MAMKWWILKPSKVSEVNNRYAFQAHFPTAVTEMTKVHFLQLKWLDSARVDTGQPSSAF